MKLLFLLIGALAFARDKASEYPAHAETTQLEIGAEYTVHSFSDGHQTFVTGDYLVVEVAVFPKSAVDIQDGQFSLRVNGKKPPILPQPPGFVAASLKYPDWTQRPTMTMEAGDGTHDVIVGGQPRVGRFPGDPTGQRRLPTPPRAPDANPTGEAKSQAPRAEDVVQSTALPEGPTARPVRGYLYFPYPGKIAKIQTLDLLFEDTTLHVFRK